MSVPADRPLVAVVSNVLTPYRQHFHLRIAREMPGIRLASLFTHGGADQPWSLVADPEINAVGFGDRDAVEQQGRWSRLPADWAKGGRIIRWLVEHHAAAVVVCGYNDGTRLRLIRWCRSRAVRCLQMVDSNIRADTARGLKLAAKRALVGWVVRSSDALLPCGTLGALYLERYGACPERVFLCPYEPDYALIATLPESAVAEAMRRYGLDSARRRLVVCSRLQPHKRVDLAIDAFARIADRRPDLDLVIIGDGPEAGALRARVPGPLAARVRWTGFLGDQALISALYRAAHVLVHPSQWEPWGVVVNEAAAAGLAIIASDGVGAAADLVRAGVNGWTFPSGDAEALAASLERATDAARLPDLRAASPRVLEDWRRRADPVQGLRAALSAVGVAGVVSQSGPLTR